DKAAVDQMVRDAQEHAEEDRQRREEVETRNQAEQLTYQAEKTLKDLGDKVSAEDRAEVETKVAALRESLKGSDLEAVKAGAGSLAETLSRVGAAAYQAAASAAGEGEPGTEGFNPDGADAFRSGDAGSTDAGPAGTGEETVEGEYKEV
ncbi:MAG TPA: Hsp70 family protein, partial [Candidatus Limnocylindrales bacterium]|nr:Hsp70 family protein [Candidatus Limnocylindrales bacterium]